VLHRLSLSLSGQHQTSVDYNNTRWYCSTTMQHHLLLDHLGKGCHECTSMLKQLRLGGCVACELLFVMRLELGDLGALLLNRIQCLYGALVSELQSRKRMEASYSDKVYLFVLLLYSSQVVGKHLLGSGRILQTLRRSLELLLKLMNRRDGARVLGSLARQLSLYRLVLSLKRLSTRHSKHAW